MAATTGRCFSVGASVPAPTDVAGGRNNFEQPFSAFGQPGPRFDQKLESIDGRKKREKQKSQKLREWDCEPRFQGRSARETRSSGLPHMEDIYSASVLQHWSPPRPLSPSQSMLLGRCAFEYFFPWALTASSSTLIARGCGGDRVRGRQLLAETAQKYFENIFHVLKD